VGGNYIIFSAADDGKLTANRIKTTGMQMMRGFILIIFQSDGGNYIVKKQWLYRGLKS
jgi:hypothetical protein